MPHDAIQINQLLVKELKKKKPNISKIIGLTNDLSQTDPEFVRFSVDAGIINRLGRELVAKKETAVSELIKNSYDADASFVNLSFSNAEESNGILVIEDDGEGMSREELINGFMRIASDEKINHPISPRYERSRAGRKGIGRFAAQRLGRKLEIITQTEKSVVALRVIVDWSSFKEGIDISVIANRLEEIPKQKLKGTSLRITKLTDRWGIESLRQIYSDVSELSQPFPILKSDFANYSSDSIQKITSTKINIKDTDPGFNISIIILKGEETQPIKINFETEISKYSLAKITGYVNEQGQGFWSFKSTKYETEESDISIGTERDSPKPYLHLKNIAFTTDYFIYLPQFLPRGRVREFKELGRKKGGIKVYRNGFRVRPYGDVGDDWLNLDKSSQNREILPPHGNQNFFGFVELTDLKGDLFEETASREGLLENLAFEELQDFVSISLKTVAQRIASIRGRKQTASQSGWESGIELPKAIKAVSLKLSDAISYARIHVQDEQTPASEALSKLLDVAEEVRQDLRKIRGTQENLLEERGMLLVLASLGLMIGEFTHEIKHTLIATQIGAKQLQSEFQEGTKQYLTASNLKKNIERFQIYASYFDRAIASNIDRELIPQDLDLVLDEFLETVGLAAERSGINITKDVDTESEFVTTPMHSSEWSSILFNLYSNSKKAIIRAKAKGKILIRLSSDSNKVYLDFSDNGDGIPSKNEERIFDAFFTTSRAVSVMDEEDSELQGSGLGLKIVRDIVTGYNGDIYLYTPTDGFITCFRIEIPRAMDEDL